MTIETKTISDLLIISDVTVNSEHRTYSTESISGIVNRRETGIQSFSGSITLTASEGYRGGKVLNAFLMGLKGKYNKFEINLGGTYGNPDVSTNPTLGATANTAADTINVTYVGSAIYAGSVFTFNNSTKLYTIMEDITGNNSSVEIIPPLKVGAVASTSLNFIDPVFTVILNSTETSITHTEGGLITSATLEWTEDLTL